jgi:DNA polymerase
MICKDGRLKGLYQMRGAKRTGRFAGRLFQSQNLSRIPKYLRGDMYQTAIELTKLEVLPLVYDKPMEVLGGIVRGVFKAPPGKKFLVADFRAVEGCNLAYRAKEDWKVEAYRNDEDLYVLTYAKSFNIDPEDVDDDSRQIGKVEELAFGYGGGVGACVSMAAIYRVDLGTLAAKVWPNLSRALREEANYNYHSKWAKKNEHYGLDQAIWMACEGLKLSWRQSNTKIMQYHYACEEEWPRSIRGQWASKVLPSGRTLWYPRPQIDNNGGLSYEGEHPITHKWVRIGTHGGKLVENYTQAECADLLTENWQELEDEGYEIVMHSHDEVVVEVPDSPEFTHEKL